MWNKIKPDGKIDLPQPTCNTLFIFLGLDKQYKLKVDYILFYGEEWKSSCCFGLCITHTHWMEIPMPEVPYVE